MTLRDRLTRRKEGEREREENSDDEPASNFDADEEAFADASGQRTNLFRALAWLTRNGATLAGVALIGGTIALAIFDAEIPRWVRILGLSGGVGMALIGRWAFGRVKDWLWSDDMVWIVDVDARETDGAIYTDPPQVFREWEIEDQPDWVAPDLVFLRDVDHENMTATGCWRGTMTDRELLRAQAAIRECRGQLERDAKRGFAIESQAFTIVRNATREALDAVTDTLARGSLPDEGDGIGDAIDGAIADFGIEPKDGLEDDDAPADDVPGLEFKLDDTEDLTLAGRGTPQNGGADGD